MQEELKALLKSEDYRLQYEISVGEKSIAVPVVYPNASAIMAFFPIAVEKAATVLKTKRLVPVSIFRGQCLLGITVFDYHESPVGPYRELALSIPVLFDPFISLPILPLIFDSLFPAFGFYTLLLAMNTDIAREHSEKIFGYPTFSRNVDIAIEEQNETIAVSVGEGDRSILNFSIKKPQRFRLAKKKYLTYFLKDGKIVSVAMQTAAASASLGCGACSLKLGEHKIVNLLKSLSIHTRAIKSVYYSDAIEILFAPKNEGSC